MDDTLKRRLLEYAEASAECGQRLAEVGMLRALKARSPQRLALHGIAWVTRTANLHLIRRALSTLPPEVTLTQDDLSAMDQAPDYDDAALRGAEWWQVFGQRDETVH